MTQALQAVLSSLPVKGKWVPNWMENLIDKKLSGIALTTLEIVSHHLLSWLYYPYQALYHKKKERIHLFNNGQTRLFDATQQASARIHKEGGTDFIYLNGRKMLFHVSPKLKMSFSKTAYYVVIRDAARGAGWFQIIEQEKPQANRQPPMEKSWLVNAN